MCPVLCEVVPILDLDPVLDGSVSCKSPALDLSLVGKHQAHNQLEKPRGKSVFIFPATQAG
jgi:hypothetical protein